MCLRYVILRHDDVADPHFDLMFETAAESLLAAWRLPVWPLQQAVRIPRLGDHRRVYLDYQGPLTDQRGSVRRITEGTCRLQVRSELLWELTLLTPAPPCKMRLLAVTADVWSAAPVP